MKSAIVTGVNGTLAPVLVAKLKSEGVDVSAWNRHQVPPDDINAVRFFLDKHNPDMLCHLAMGDADWAKTLAIETKKRNIKMLFTSTAMVFHHIPDGPHRVNDTRTAIDDYGKSKIACEDVIMENNPNAVIARIYPNYLKILAFSVRIKGFRQGKLEKAWLFSRRYNLTQYKSF